MDREIVPALPMTVMLYVPDGVPLAGGGGLSPPQAACKTIAAKSKPPIAITASFPFAAFLEPNRNRPKTIVARGKHRAKNHPK